MKCLYLHGLESQPMKEKDDILCVNFEQVVSPKLNYRQPKIFSEICETVEKEKIEILVGSSFGGFMSFFLAQKYGLSAILFNPALAYYSTNPEIIDDFDVLEMKKVFVAIGEQDDVVLPQSTIDFLKNEDYRAEILHVEIVKDLGHRIPIDVFDNIITSAKNKFLDSRIPDSK